MSLYIKFYMVLIVGAVFKHDRYGIGNILKGRFKYVIILFYDAFNA